MGVVVRCFNPRRPRGRRPAPRPRSRAAGGEVSTHAARAGGDPSPVAAQGAARRFNPRRPRGRRLAGSFSLTSLYRFQPTPPARAATPGRSGPVARWRGFQPTPPARAATRRSATKRDSNHRFNPRRPRGRRQGEDHHPRGEADRFNPRRPRGRRPPRYPPACPPSPFQPTPPARAATGILVGIRGLGSAVSTHAARAGGDYMASLASPDCALFQPTPPARAATPSRCTSTMPSTSCFNPRRPRGRRPDKAFAHPARRKGFNPRRPRGRRPSRCTYCAGRCGFQPTPPARAATGRSGGGGGGVGVSTHAARAGGDPASWLRGRGRNRFNPRRPRGRRHRSSKTARRRRRFNPRRPRGRRQALLRP